MDGMNVPMRLTLKVTPGIPLTDALYAQYKRLIEKEAWSVSRMCTTSFDELLSRGNLLFCEAANTYRPGKGAFSTHLTWKLKTLREAVSEMYAPKTCTDERTFWASLEQATSGKEGEEICGDPLQASTEYSQKMEETVDDASWEERIPDFRQYMNAMDDDTRTLCNDILDGQFDEREKASSLGRKAYLRKMSCIPTHRYWAKRYIKFGWSMQRTQRAVDNLRQLLRQWMQDKLPCTLIHVEDIKQSELF